MAKRILRNERFCNKHSCWFQKIELGQSVQIQNQTRPYWRQWEKTGRVVEAHGNRQYHIRVDGSNPVTRHNHHFLREIGPVIDNRYYLWPEDSPNILDEPDIPTGLGLQHMRPQSTHYQLEPLDMERMEVEDLNIPKGIDTLTAMGIDEDQGQPLPNQGTHHSTRPSWPAKDLSLQMRCTSHTLSKCSCTWPQPENLEVPWEEGVYWWLEEYYLRMLWKSDTAS